MIRIPIDLQPYIELVDGKVVTKETIPKELHKDYVEFKKWYRDLRKNNPLTEF